MINSIETESPFPQPEIAQKEIKKDKQQLPITQLKEFNKKELDPAKLKKEIFFIKENIKLSLKSIYSESTQDWDGPILIAHGINVYRNETEKKFIDIDDNSSTFKMSDFENEYEKQNERTSPKWWVMENGHTIKSYLEFLHKEYGTKRIALMTCNPHCEHLKHIPGYEKILYASGDVTSSNKELPNYGQEYEAGNWYNTKMKKRNHKISASINSFHN